MPGPLRSWRTSCSCVEGNLRLTGACPEQSRPPFFRVRYPRSRLRPRSEHSSVRFVRRIRSDYLVLSGPSCRKTDALGVYAISDRSRWMRGRHGYASQHDRHSGRRPPVGRLRSGWTSVRGDTQHRSDRVRGCPLPQRVREHAAVLAEPGLVPHGPVCAYQRDRGQPRPQRNESPAPDVPQGTQRGRLRDGVHRQVAYGQRR